MNKTLRKILVWLLILVLVGGAAYFFLLRNTEISYKEEVAKLMDIETFYTFTGNLASDDFSVVVATSRGEVEELLFEEGDEVTTKDVVLRTSNGRTIKANMDGTISHIYLDEGDSFNPGTQLFRIADYSDPHIKIRVDEYDVSALRKGTGCRVRILSTGEEIQGTIKRIAQEATVSGDLAFYDVTISVPQDGSLVMGLSCEIYVPRHSVQNAVTVSMNAIQYDDNGKPFVYCFDRNKEVAQQSVVLGVNNGTVVEIRSGIAAGETILIPPSLNFADMMNMSRKMTGGF